MVLVDYKGIFFTCGNTFGHILYTVKLSANAPKIIGVTSKCDGNFAVYSSFRHFFPIYIYALLV
jgi:hypothetical protein